MRFLAPPVLACRNSSAAELQTRQQHSLELRIPPSLELFCLYFILSLLSSGIWNGRSPNYRRQSAVVIEALLFPLFLPFGIPPQTQLQLSTRTTMASPVPVSEDQTRLLEEALGVVRQQSQMMRKCLETPGKLMDALKCG